MAKAASFRTAISSSRAMTVNLTREETPLSSLVVWKAWCYKTAVDLAQCWEWQGRWQMVLLVVVLQVVRVVNVFFVLMPLSSLLLCSYCCHCCSHAFLLECTHHSFPPSKSLGRNETCSRGASPSSYTYIVCVVQRCARANHNKDFKEHHFVPKETESHGCSKQPVQLHPFPAKEPLKPSVSSRFLYFSSNASTAWIMTCPSIFVPGSRSKKPWSLICWTWYKGPAQIFDSNQQHSFLIFIFVLDIRNLRGEQGELVGSFGGQLHVASLSITPLFR